ncbi:hypothetical protein [Fibrobacter sp.]|uniref:hypothetical protein n=1 Tax=Fibrobacter sp. TaxID=35828 RepID=UPI00389009AB
MAEKSGLIESLLQAFKKGYNNKISDVDNFVYNYARDAARPKFYPNGDDASVYWNVGVGDYMGSLKPSSWNEAFNQLDIFGDHMSDFIRRGRHELMHYGLWRRMLEDPNLRSLHDNWPVHGAKPDWTYVHPETVLASDALVVNPKVKWYEPNILDEDSVIDQMDTYRRSVIPNYDKLPEFSKEIFDDWLTKTTGWNFNGRYEADAARHATHERPPQIYELLSDEQTLDLLGDWGKPLTEILNNSIK